MRQQKFGLALKKFHETFQHFHDIQEDQFDFHSYCFRKTTLRTYVRFLRMQDDLYSHKFYRRAAKAAMIIYKQILDNPVDEKKKLKHQQKREAKSKEKQEGGSKTDDKSAGAKGKKDDDPKGEKLLAPEKIEEDILTIVRNLCKFC